MTLLEISQSLSAILKAVNILPDNITDNHRKRKHHVEINELEYGWNTGSHIDILILTPMQLLEPVTFM